MNVKSRSCSTRQTLKQKIGKLDDQLRLSKKNHNTDVSPQAETDNIKDIPPKIAGNAMNNNLEGSEYDVEQELGAAAANGGNSSV